MKIKTSNWFSGLFYSAVFCAVLSLSIGCQKSAEPPATDSTPVEQTESPESSDPHEQKNEQKSPQPEDSMPAAPAPPSAGQETPASEPESRKPPVPSQSNEVSSEKTPLKYINQLTPEEIAEGWILLFDNETLFGWKKETEINWAVNDQAITADTGPNGLLLTEVAFADFELSLEFKAAPGANAGVFVRCTDPPGHPETHCYEVNIADGHPQGYHTGSIVFLKTADPGVPTTNNEWHKLHIIADKNEIRVTLNDKLLTEFKDERETWLKSGLIGLQKNTEAVAYRNIRLKPLNQKDLFNGSDLSGWSEVPDGKSVIDVVEGAIHVVNGPGFLETQETFKDFLLQFQTKTNAADLNSGLFFRAEKGTAEAPSNGYEVQIHNGFKEEDRNQPSNAGTGAIFRRIDARRVTANDLEWANITLVADGPQIATWVEGYPVVNWRDDRKADPNPRKGLRLEGGHLSLQGHDPTTDILFKKIQVQEIPR